jgi:hypothetical protein
MPRVPKVILLDYLPTLAELTAILRLGGGIVRERPELSPPIRGPTATGTAPLTGPGGSETSPSQLPSLLGTS